MAESNLPILPEGLSGLPEPVTRNALKALTHFLGGGASYFGEWIRRPTQSVADVTDGRQIVSTMLAEEVGRRAIADPQIVAAAAEKLLPGYARKLSNRFAVAEQTVRELAAFAKETEQEKLSAPTEEVDPDWLNNFERFAEDANSENMRNLWGRVLAGKVRHPGSFSKATLRVLYELDQDVAEAFEAIRPHIVDDQVLSLRDVLDEPSAQDVPLAELLVLEAAGILTGADGMIGWYFTISDEGFRTVPAGADALAVFGQSGAKVNLTARPLSKVGRDFARLLPNRDARVKLVSLAEYLNDNRENLGLTGAFLGPLHHAEGSEPAVVLSDGEWLWGSRQ